MKNVDGISCDRQYAQLSASKSVRSAISNLQKSISFGKESPQAYLLLGQAHCLLNEPARALDYLHIYTNLRPDNPLGYLETVTAIERLCAGDGIELLLQSIDWHSQEEFDLNPCEDPELNLRYKYSMSKASIRVDDLLDNARYAYDEKQYETALGYYERILYLESENRTSWSMIGKICQAENSLYDICEAFIRQNDDNLFVDNTFIHDTLFEMWAPYEYTKDTRYSLTPCPGLELENCVSIRIESNPPKNGAGVYQCMQLTEGKNYRYSAWVNSNAVEWQSLYYQGNISGNPVGHSYNIKDDEYAGGWHYFEEEFTAQKYDDKVCFYPVRLKGEGQVWFYNPRLELIDPIISPE